MKIVNTIIGGIILLLMLISAIYGSNQLVTNGYYLITNHSKIVGPAFKEDSNEGAKNNSNNTPNTDKSEEGEPNGSSKKKKAECYNKLQSNLIWAGLSLIAMGVLVFIISNLAFALYFVKKQQE